MSMHPEEFREFLRRQPFQPFRITLTDGRTYDIFHPELAMVGHSTIAIGLLGDDNEEPIYDRLVTISLLHVMQIEPVEHSSNS